MQCSMAWALHRTEKEKPAAGKTDYWRDFWRSGWDSNPRNLAVQLISSQSRYDHFDTAPYLSQHQHLGKRGELMGRTSKNIKLRIPEKPHKIKGFRTGSYRVATAISRLTFHFDGPNYIVTFTIMFIVTLLSGSLATRLKENAKQSAHTAYRTKILFETNQLLQKEQDENAVTRMPFVCCRAYYRTTHFLY